MRYTTPEWLLENLEQRVRLALGQMSRLEDSVSSGVVALPELAGSEVAPATSFQRAA